ncbi:Methyltransferase domain-containing protein [Micromonospora pallida]|uniref:Methyltransferase domain-containing protein n=1 Tax=Micromonospora pallida TaxID=145854 RepID=A0A1C6SEN0_9ACTN|nr:methyltransferase domain-containing protein [Micromonospora pallida]SCL27808.1 Methyltransferase domain-containing protein [Micromonospora pallida]
MSRLGSPTAAPDQITYLDTAAATPVGLDYKRRLVEALDVRTGQTVVDLGCGPGTDLAALADAVGPDGTVFGVDLEPRMVAEASRRHADRPNVEVRAGDVHELPLADASVDRIRVDRVLQHLSDPARVFAEARRALRPGGFFGMAEPDWDTLAVADEDVATSRRFARFTAGRVRNATIGRQLVGLATRAGFRVRSVDPMAVLFRDFDTADQILGLRRNTARAVQAGELAETDGRAWLHRLETGPVLAGFTFYLVTAEA